MAVARRRSVVALVLALAAGCAGDVDRLAPDASVEATTTSPSPATTTTAPPLATPTTTPPLATPTTAPAPADLQDIIATTTMTERARRIFLAANPAIEDGATFARSCGVEQRPDPPSQPTTHTRGCYVAGRIHLLAPERAETRDLLYVVAAHELLHAVYGVLGAGERARVDAEVEAARAGNERLEERLRPYASSPTLANEMHSILGSEFDGLPPALEAHYAQYFSNRAAVVAARQRTLGTREDEMRRLKAEIDDLGARISALRETQEQLRAAGDVRTYNANVPVVNGLIDRYNARVDALNAVVAEYNGLLSG